MEILYQEPIMALSLACQALIIIIAAIATISFIVCIVSSNKKIWKPAGILSLILYLITCFLITSGPKVETGRQEYMVQFNDDISFVEIYDKYDVIEQRGDIWTIQDKEIK